MKCYTQWRVVEVEHQVVGGTPKRVETLRHHLQGDEVINAAYSERMHATFRERLAALTGRECALARHLVTLEQGMYLVGTVYNFYLPHRSPGRGGTVTTPAMAAGLTDHRWTVYELLAFHVRLLVGHHQSGVGASHKSCNA